ncbi:MAG: hypothetical protein FJ077_14370 [Cyanobacteria bacterium K_DeepCast_35m_m2_023]|nr:hypothetical protein [Cyanobacteria bacterium K_DeepCast_35m_m2_023]
MFLEVPLSRWWLLLVALLLLAPSPAGRVLLDVVGGITLLLVLLPLGVGALGWLGWVLIQRRMRTCPACGFRSLGTEVCPACGTVFTTDTASAAAAGSNSPNPRFDARDVTIDVKATDVDSE